MEIINAQLGGHEGVWTDDLLLPRGNFGVDKVEDLIKELK